MVAQFSTKTPGNSKANQNNELLNEETLRQRQTVHTVIGLAHMNMKIMIRSSFNDLELCELSYAFDGCSIEVIWKKGKRFSCILIL